MADVRKDPQQGARTGIAPTYGGGLSTSDQYLTNNDGRVFLHFKKSGAGACTVTVITPNTVDGLALADITITVPATTGDVMAGPFAPGLVNDGNSDMRWTVSEITGLTVAVVRV